MDRETISFPGDSREELPGTQPARSDVAAEITVRNKGEVGSGRRVSRRRGKNK